MAMSISDVTKRRGRPVTTGKGQPITLRLQSELLAAVDNWAASEDDVPSRPEAVRRLIQRGLSV